MNQNSSISKATSASHRRALVRLSQTDFDYSCTLWYDTVVQFQHDPSKRYQETILVQVWYFLCSTLHINSVDSTDCESAEQIGPPCCFCLYFSHGTCIRKEGKNGNQPRPATTDSQPDTATTIRWINQQRWWYQCQRKTEPTTAGPWNG